MGLDQYAWKVTGNKREEIAYWRKHNRLQGWMENLWHSKGGAGEFNCVDVELDEEDLDELEIKIKERKLPPTDGFFFGTDSYRISDDYHGYEDEPTDLQFIEDARKVISKGDKVVYSCWW